MANSDAKALLLLAASDLDGSELRQFFRLIETLGASLVVRRVSDLRQAADIELGSGEKSVRNRGRESEYDLILRKVTDFLTKDASLSRTDAANILRLEIAKEYGSKYYIPPFNKIGFELWLQRLLDQVPASLVTHIATRIRNDIVHGKREVSDWPLIRG